MTVTISEHSNCTNIQLVPESAKEIALLTRLALNTKPDGVEFATYFNNETIDANIHFEFVKNKRSSVRNTSRRRRL